MLVQGSRTALMLAVEMRYKELVWLLLARGADVRVADPVSVVLCISCLYYLVGREHGTAGVDAAGQGGGCAGSRPSKSHALLVAWLSLLCGWLSTTLSAVRLL